MRMDLSVDLKNTHYEADFDSYTEVYFKRECLLVPVYLLLCKMYQLHNSTSTGSRCSLKERIYEMGKLSVVVQPNENFVLSNPLF